MNKTLAQCVDLDKELVECARSIKVLSSLAWPTQARATFLASWHAGKPELPSITHSPFKPGTSTERLGSLMKRCDRTHAVGNYIFETAESYLVASEMLSSMGTPRFTELSAHLYGLPSDPIGFGKTSILDAAESFIRSTDDFASVCEVNEEDVCVLPATVAEELQTAVSEFFVDHQIDVVIDDKLTAKAAAGSRRIRIRGSTCFTWGDIPQLLHHECLMHSLSLINGGEQPYLKSMGLGAPRTTRTQEGLAVFAELITSSMDLSRLRRIALRVKATAYALQGANFIELFEFFQNSGQNELESFQSTARIFRGGDVRGSVVFTKDGMYLQGLIHVHLFLKKAIQEGKLNFPHYLCCGRVALADILELEEFFNNGFIAMPCYQPQWLVNRPCLTAFLLYSNYLKEVAIGDLTLRDFIHKRI